MDVMFTTVLGVVLFLRGMSSYSLIFREKDDITNPQKYCHTLYRGKIAKKEDVVKYKEMILTCLSENSSFWIGPFSNVNRTNQFQGYKCNIIQANYSVEVNCSKGHIFQRLRGYLCKIKDRNNVSLQGGKICTERISTANKVDISVTKPVLRVHTTSKQLLPTLFEKQSKVLNTDSSINTSTVEMVESRNRQIHDGVTAHTENIVTHKVAEDSFIDRYKVQVGIVLGTLLFIVVMLLAVTLLFKLKRRTSNLRWKSTDPGIPRGRHNRHSINRFHPEEWEESCVISNDIEIFKLDDDHDASGRVVYDHLQRSVSDTCLDDENE